METSNEFDDRRSMLEEKTIEEIVSLWYTYNQLFKAANFQRHLGRGISISIASLGGILSFGLIWDGIGHSLMIALAVLVSVLSALRTALRPAEKQRELRDAANLYKDLCEEAQVLLELDLSNVQTTNEEIETRVREINERRRQLNKDTPDVSSIWYHYVKLRKGTDALEEISVSDSERAVVLGHDS